MASSNIAQRDCDLLNSSIVSFEEIQFLAPDSSEPGSSNCVGEFQPAQPISQSADWAFYRAVYNRSPVMVKKVKILDSLPNRFSEADIQALWSTPVKMTTYRLLREVIVGLALPRHGNLCHVIGWALPPNEGKVAVTSSFFIILDHFDTDLGSCLDRLYRTKGPLACRPEGGGPLGWEQFFLVAAKLAAGLTRLGQVRSGSGTGDRSRTDYVIHGDLKLANVFVSYALHEPAVASSAWRNNSSRSASEQTISNVAIGNFSRSRIEGGEAAMVRTTTSNLGALFYQAPELLDPIGFPKEERLTPQIDIFSYGIVLWRILHYPKQLEEDFEVQFSSPQSFNEAVAKGEIQPTMDPSLPVDIAALILDCCAHRPSKRPQAQELLDRLPSTEIYRKCEKRGDAQQVVRDTRLRPEPEKAIVGEQ